MSEVPDGSRRAASIRIYSRRAVRFAYAVRFDLLMQCCFDSLVPHRFDAGVSHSHAMSGSIGQKLLQFLQFGRAAVGNVVDLPAIVGLGVQAVLHAVGD